MKNIKINYGLKKQSGIPSYNCYGTRERRRQYKKMHQKSEKKREESINRKIEKYKANLRFDFRDLVSFIIVSILLFNIIKLSF